jgi:hypothetical protein
MFLNAFTNRSRPPGRKGRRKQQLRFDFIVAERPIYVPGSGPPLAPVTVMPAHDKDGIIQGETKMHNQLMYIITYEDHPYLRVSVKPQNILEWVSPRTFEEWEFAKTQAEYQAEEDELLPKIAARERRKKLKEQGAKSHGIEGPKKTWSRKRKRPPTPEPPSRASRKRRGVDTEDEESVGINPRRPSLSTPVKQHGLADMLDLDDSEDEEDSFAEDTAELLDHQLNGTPRGRSKLALEVTRLATTSPEPQPLKVQKPKKPPVPRFNLRETRSSSISSTPGGKDRETRSSSTSRPSSRQDSVAATSSRQARAIYEKLERKSQAKAGLLTETYSYSGKPPTSSQRQAAANASARQKSETPKRKKSATPKPVEEDDGEYEVDSILADEYRKNKKGKYDLYYLIKWVGDWANTWEPAHNVGVEAIAEYQAKKATEKEGMKMPSKSKMSYDGAASSSEDSDLKGKGNVKVPFGSGGRDLEVREKGKTKIPFGSGGIDLTGESEESDPDSLFIKDRSPEKAPVQERDELIDDLSVSDEF